MTEIGKIHDRIIFYSNVRRDVKWFEKLPSTNWLAFTIADKVDQDLLNDTTKKCLDYGVLYTCSVGELGSETEDYFDGEIVWRQVQIEEKTGKPQDYETSPMTTFHRDFSEGFWFATCSANAIVYDEYIQIEKVVCIDMTYFGVRNYLLKLIDKITRGNLPSDNNFGDVFYDCEK